MTNMLHRLRTTAVVVGLLAALAPRVYGQDGGAGAAQGYPSKPIRLIVAFATGGSTDVISRLVAEKLSARLGQQVVVENRTGANGNIGTEFVARSAPDGYTILMGFDGTLVINPSMYAKLPFDTVKDFAPITRVANNTLVLAAHPSVPVGSIKELVAYAAKHPGQLSYGTAGTGSTPHLAGEMLRQRTGIDMVHIPYKGGGQAVVDAVGGQVPMIFSVFATVAPHVKAGKLKPLGVAAGQRTAAFPDVPTFIENGLAEFDVNSWVGLLAPAGTPKPIVDRLYRETLAVLALPDVRERLATLGAEPVGNTPEQFAAELKSEIARWSTVVKAAGIQAQ